MADVQHSALTTTNLHNPKGMTVDTTSTILTIDSSGNVGINQVSPAYKLDTNGTARVSSLNINSVIDFPTADGSADEAIITDGAGNLSFKKRVQSIGISGSSGLSDDVILVSGTNITLAQSDNTITISSASGGSGGGAPTDATYITQTANGTLTNEQAIGSLSTGLMKVATGTGIVSSITDSSSNWDLAFSHISASGTSHSDVVLNNVHRISDGSDHSFIDQDVTSASSPTFVTVTGSITGNAGTVTDGVYTTDFPLNQNTTGSSASCTGESATVATITGLAPDTQNTYARTQYLIPYASTTTAFGEIAIGDADQVLTSNGAGSAPTFQAAASGSSGGITYAILLG